jgi:hypothetical protein
MEYFTHTDDYSKSAIKYRTDLMKRMVRLETKIERGFAEIGVDINQKNIWLEVDDANNVVYIDNLGRALKVIIKTMEKMGASKHLESYKIIHNENVIGSIIYDINLGE